MSLDNNPQNDIGTKLNHSGNLPEAMREIKVNDFDKTSLREAVDQGLINVPETTEAVGSWTPSTETTPSTVEKKGFSTKQKIIAGISGTALALGIGAGLKSMNNTNGEQITPVSPVATAPVTPGEATPDTSATSEIAGGLTIEAMDAQTIDQFVNDPNSDKLRYANSILGGDAMVAIGAKWSAAANNDPHLAVVNASPDNTAQEVANQFKLKVAYAAWAITKPAQPGILQELDQPKIAKFVNAMYYNANPASPLYAAYMNKMEISGSFKYPTRTGDVLTANNASAIVKDITVDGKSLRSIEFVLTDASTAGVVAEVTDITWVYSVVDGVGSWQILTATPN